MVFNWGPTTLAESVIRHVPLREDCTGKPGTLYVSLYNNFLSQYSNVDHGRPMRKTVRLSFASKLLLLNPGASTSFCMVSRSDDLIKVMEILHSC